MARRINVPNNTRMPIYVGSAMIPPGESREFDENDVPLHLRPKAAAPAPQPKAPPADPLAELAAKSAKDVIAALPELAPESLTALEKIEQARKDGDMPAPRKTVLEAIGAEILKRAGGQE